MCVGVYICVCVYRTIFLVMLQHPDLFFSSVMQTVITCEKLKNAPPVLMRHTRCTETFNATVAFLHDSLWFSEKHACPLAFSSYCAILKTINITTLKRHGATSMEAQGLDVGFRNTPSPFTIPYPGAMLQKQGPLSPNLWTNRLDSEGWNKM